MVGEASRVRQYGLDMPVSGGDMAAGQTHAAAVLRAIPLFFFNLSDIDIVDEVESLLGPTGTRRGVWRRRSIT